MATKKAKAPGGAIRDYLKRHGLSQREFADSLGVTQGAVSQWIRGTTGIGQATAAEIIRVTGGEVSVSDLYPKLFGSG